MGELRQSGVPLNRLNPVFLFSDLMDTRFSGFVVVTIEGFSGIEEGVVFFREGQLAGAAFSYDHPDVSVFGNAALDSAFNACLAKRGVLDVVSLSRQQVDLVLALEEKVAVSLSPVKADLAKKLAGPFSDRFAQTALRSTQQETVDRHELLKKLGLAELAK